MRDVKISSYSPSVQITLQSAITNTAKVVSSFHIVREPNFVLINYNVNSFGDFKEVVTIAEPVIEKLEFYLNQARLLACILASIVIQMLQSVAYYTYQLVISVWQLAENLSKLQIWLWPYLSEVLALLTSSKTRDLWFLHQKLSSKHWLNDIQKFLSTLLYFIGKFYLFFIIIFVVAGLKITPSITFSSSFSGFDNKTQPENNNQHKSNIINLTNPVTQVETGSLISKVFDRNSNSQLNTLIETQSNLPEAQIATLNRLVDTTDAYLYLPKITQHQVKEGENLETISDLYNLNPETISTNNPIQEEGKLPQILNIPFRDGYIYTLTRDIGVDDLAMAFEVSPNLIYSENEDDLNRQTSKFDKGSQLLIPDVNYQIVDKAVKKLQTAVVDITNKRSQRILPNLENFNSNSNLRTYENQVSEEKNDVGFIWPTTGRISRCVVGSHVACDISNKQSPPVYSVASGTVIAGGYGYEPRGYGNALLIDHGNGLTTLYAHLSEVYVNVGDSLSQGQSIGRMGSSGLSTGIHLHFEVRANGQKKNPLNYLPK